MNFKINLLPITYRLHDNVFPNGAVFIILCLKGCTICYHTRKTNFKFSEYTIKKKYFKFVLNNFLHSWKKLFLCNKKKCSVFFLQHFFHISLHTHTSTRLSYKYVICQNLIHFTTQIGGFCVYLRNYLLWQSKLRDSTQTQ